MSTQLVEKLNQWASDPRNIEVAREACPTHVLMHGTMGFAFGGFLGMFLASMSGGAGAPEARLLSGSTGLAGDISALPMKTQMRLALSDMAARSWSSAKNFGKIAAIFSGAECIIEGYRAKHDIVNTLSAGCFTGGVLSAKAGPKAALLGCAGFAAFSAAIEHFLQDR